MWQTAPVVLVNWKLWLMRPEIRSSTCAVFTTALHVLVWMVWSSVWVCVCPFSSSLRHFLASDLSSPYSSIYKFTLTFDKVEIHIGDLLKKAEVLLLEPHWSVLKNIVFCVGGYGQKLVCSLNWKQCWRLEGLVTLLWLLWIQKKWSIQYFEVRFLMMELMNSCGKSLPFVTFAKNARSMRRMCKKYDYFFTAVFLNMWSTCSCRVAVWLILRHKLFLALYETKQDSQGWVWTHP